MNAVTSGIQPAASCAGILGGGDVSILDNDVVIYGAGAPLGLPAEAANIFVASTSAKICGNKTSVGNDIVEVNGAPPHSATGRAYHIYYGSTGTVNNADVSLNFVNNFDNVGAVKCLNGVYLEYLAGAPTHTHIKAQGNQIRGSNLTTGGLGHTVPCAIGNYPFEYANMLLGTGANTVYVVAFDDVVLAEGATIGVERPTIYFLTIGNITQEPFNTTFAKANCWATNESPAAYW